MQCIATIQSKKNTLYGYCCLNKAVIGKFCGKHKGQQHNIQTNSLTIINTKNNRTYNHIGQCQAIITSIKSKHYNSKCINQAVTGKFCYIHKKYLTLDSDRLIARKLEKLKVWGIFSNPCIYVVKPLNQFYRSLYDSMNTFEGVCYDTDEKKIDGFTINRWKSVNLSLKESGNSDEPDIWTASDKKETNYSHFRVKDYNIQDAALVEDNKNIA